MVDSIVSIKARHKDSVKNGAPQTTETDFIRGRDLAIALLAEGQRIHNISPADNSYSYRWYRGGRPQNCFAESYLQQLVANPRAMQGFAAVLSAELASGDYTDIELSYRIPMAEYMPGAVGADGTKDLGVDGESLDTTVAPSTPDAVSPYDLNERFGLAYDASGQIEAIANLLLREKDSATEEFENRILPPMLRRLKGLNSVILSALGDDNTRATTEMHAVVHGSDFD